MNKLENNFLSIYMQAVLFNAFIWVILKSFGTKLIEIFFVDFKSSYFISDVLGNFKSRRKKSCKKWKCGSWDSFWDAKLAALQKCLCKQKNDIFGALWKKATFFKRKHIFFVEKQKKHVNSTSYIIWLIRSCWTFSKLLLFKNCFIRWVIAFRNRLICFED